jgi:hypothetical protein
MSDEQVKSEKPTKEEKKLEKETADELAKVKRELKKLKSIHPTTPSIIEPTGNIGGSAVACMVASDWHVEEPVIKERVHGINEYSMEIAKQRSQAFFANGLRLTDIFGRSSVIDTIFLYLGGDFITNYIHEENRESNEVGPSVAINYALQQLIDGINYLLFNSNYKLIIDCVAGNHGRMTKQIRASNMASTNLETFMYQCLASHFKGNDRITIRVAEGRMLYRKFYDMTVRMIHGDDISYGGGVGGITIPIRKKLAGWDKAIKADLTLMGHFHQLINGGDFLVNGSLIGYNEYAQSIGASPEEARQTFFLIHSRKGGQLGMYAPIWLD